MMNTDKKSGKGFWQKLNDAVTEVGIEHADDDFDWDQRVKLPEWTASPVERTLCKTSAVKETEKIGQKISAKVRTKISDVTPPNH